MPESKEIKIDEIVTADGNASSGSRRAGDSEAPPYSSDDPLAGFKKSLGWKARATLWATQKFLYLRGKSWGKWVIVPLVFLAVLLAVPVGLLLLAAAAARAAFLSLRPPR